MAFNEKITNNSSGLKSAWLPTYGHLFGQPCCAEQKIKLSPVTYIAGAQQ